MKNDEEKKNKDTRLVWSGRSVIQDPRDTRSYAVILEHNTLNAAYVLHVCEVKRDMLGNTYMSEISDGRREYVLAACIKDLAPRGQVTPEMITSLRQSG